ncbi:MAG: dTMP kinase [Candidatus Omnitrophica bacterium]|nr:dTMP kinase [Candidatus Omnitrophota bacterium]
MMARRRRGLFVTFEGTEGSGKTTQIKLLAASLRKRGFKVLVTREPGGTVIGKRIRGMLLGTRSVMCSETETLLYMASRAELVDQVLLPALKKGSMILCDRWIDATRAYQGSGLGVSRAWIESVGRGATRGLEPDLTFFLDVPVRQGLERAKRRGKLDRVEQRQLAFHRRVRRGYLELARNYKRFHKISAGAVGPMHEAILGVIDRVL